MLDLLLARLALRLRLILTRFHPRDFCETIGGKFDRKLAWFWSPAVKVATVPPRCKSEDG